MNYEAEDLAPPLMELADGAGFWHLRGVIEAAEEEAGETHRTVLESGDVVIMAREARRASHRVLKVHSPSLLSRSSLRQGRISLTIRRARRLTLAERVRRARVGIDERDVAGPFTCETCGERDSCAWAFDAFNLRGDCIASR